MKIDEQFDTDEVLRDIDEQNADNYADNGEEMRELNFGSRYHENANYSDMADALGNGEDLWN